MDGYEIGKDIQQIKDRLARIEEAIGLGSDLPQTPGPIQTHGVDGGVEITNVRREGNNICGDVRVFASASALGRSWDWDKTWPHVCIAVGAACFTLFDEGVGPADVKVEVCYEDGNLCVELKVKVFGLSKSWKKCKGVA